MGQLQVRCSGENRVRTRVFTKLLLPASLGRSAQWAEGNRHLTRHGTVTRKMVALCARDARLDAARHFERVDPLEVRKSGVRDARLAAVIY